MTAVFMSSCLLFSLEPMSSKLILPKLGGSPSVWITCLLFFQAALLAGYCYTHLSIRLLGLRRQAILHIALLAVSLAFIPISIDTVADATGNNRPLVWLLGTLTTSIGLPFLVLSSFAPLAQRWLSEGPGTSAKNPYHLYAASNLGSLLALLAYPFIVEPLLALRNQTTIWSGLYVAVMGATALLGLGVARRKTLEVASSAEPRNRVSMSDRFRWIAYAAVPSSALMGATSFISLDLGSFPLLWVIPLAVYLATFILVFAKRPPLRHAWMVKAEPQMIVLVSLTIFWAIGMPAIPFVLMHLALLFLIAMVCHGELARTRPDPRDLTEFYLWIAVGGLLGGVFNAVVAPVVFDDVFEYPLVIVAAAFMRPWPKRGNALSDVIAVVAFGIALLIATWRPGIPPQLVPTLSMFVFGMILFSFRDRPRRFGLALAIMFAIGLTRLTALPSGRILIDKERSFFGVYRVLENRAGTLRMLEHGSTIHGVQSLRSDSRLTPLSYYHKNGPVPDLFAAGKLRNSSSRRVALVGLGVGSLSCYGRAGEQWTYYEIDPVVAKVATDTAHFTLLRDCPPETRIVFGDARITLGQRAGASADIVIVDAFNSGSIPVHLLTREALQEYLRVLDEGGLIAIHISNEHMDLEPLVAALVDDMKIAGLVRHDFHRSESISARVEYASSSWVLLARAVEDLGGLPATWQSLRKSEGMRPWTDDFSNIVSVIRWK